MAAKIRLLWTNTSTGANVTQMVQRRLNDEVEWTDYTYAATITALDATSFEFVDPSIDFATDTIVSYRIMSGNGSYALPGNEVSVNVNATPTAVADLSAAIVVDDV